MATLYEKGAAIALRQITKFGQPVHVIRRDLSVNPVTGKPDPTAEPETFAGHGIVVDYDRRTIEQSAVLREGDLQAICVGIPRPEPEHDALVVRGVEYRIIAASVVAPDGTDIVYEVSLR